MSEVDGAQVEVDPDALEAYAAVLRRFAGQARSALENLRVVRRFIRDDLDDSAIGGFAQAQALWERHRLVYEGYHATLDVTQHNLVTLAEAAQRIAAEYRAAEEANVKAMRLRER